MKGSSASSECPERLPEPRRAGPGDPDAFASLLGWYDRSGRTLPWRVRPEDRAQGKKPDPYRVWLSEIMLQQTRVAAVIPYYDAFLEGWPTVEALADAPVEAVMERWAGLGYYARARNLHTCARQVARRHGGRFPETEAELRSLPGIGPYTAAAIAAIAFDAPTVPVDGNVERVLARVHGVQAPLPAAKPQLRALALLLAPNPRPGDFAQALMDLGATVCTPRNPDCPRCPWASGCVANRNGSASELPRRLAEARPPGAARCGIPRHAGGRGSLAETAKGGGPPRRNARPSGNRMDGRRPEGGGMSRLQHPSPQTGIRSRGASATCSRILSCG